MVDNNEILGPILQLGQTLNAFQLQITIEFSELMSSSKVSGLWLLIILQLLILIKKSFKNKAQNEIWSDFEIGVLCYNTSQL